MSDVMMFGVLSMPFDMAMRNDLSRSQFHSRAREAVERILALQDEVAALRAQLSAQSVSAVQPFGWVNSVNAEFTRKTGGSVALWPKKYDDTDLALYTRSADADAVDAKEKT